MADNDAIKVHDLRPAPGAKTAKTRVGRGEASKGKTAGRGTKGSGSRVQVSARFEGGQTPLFMRLPKLSGFKNNNKVVFQVVNLDRIASLFPNGGTIDPDTLADAGAVRRGEEALTDISARVAAGDEITILLDPPEELTAPRPGRRSLPGRRWGPGRPAGSCRGGAHPG